MYILHLTKADIRFQVKWVVSLVDAYAQFNLPQCVFVGMYGLTLSLYHPRGHRVTPNTMDFFNIIILRADKNHGDIDMFRELMILLQSLVLSTYNS